MSTYALGSQIASKWQDSFNRLNHEQPAIFGLLAFSEAWALARDYLRPRDFNLPAKQFGRDVDEARVQQAIDLLARCKRLPVMLEVYLEDVKDSFHLVAAEVEKYMNEYVAQGKPEVIAVLVLRLMKWHRTWTPKLDLGPTVTSAFNLSFQTHLFAILPPLFATGFKALCSYTLSPPDTSTLDVRSLWIAFDTLGLVDRYESLIASVGYDCIDEHVENICAGNWDRPFLEELSDWMSKKIVPWLIMTYAPKATTAEEARVLLQNVASRFEFHLHKSLCNLRIKEIFDIIVDYPDSAGALEDLKECFQRVDQRTALVESLRKQNKRRLLHPGADTSSILMQYVSMIKCLRAIDPAGVLLFKIADPIRRYLRGRPDTIRCIVSNLVGDPSDDAENLVDDSEPPVPIQSTPDIDGYLDPTWEPEPLDAGPDFRAGRPSDIITTLVSIYSSHDLFIKELQVLLAQRLLLRQSLGENVEQERRHIEVLKVRFGEAALQVCEVMMRDMTDSKRTDQHVQSRSSTILHPTIISKHFWPSMGKSELVLPGQFQALQDAYNKEYSKFKPDKKLRWLNNLGTVDLTIELEDRKVEAKVPPLEAAFIELFQTKGSWTIKELITCVGGKVDKPTAAKALSTWVDLGVLAEYSEGVYMLLERMTDDFGTAPARPIPEAAEEADIPGNTERQHIELMKNNWPSIHVMLTNLGQLPLDRIQNMLKLRPNYNGTIEQLGAFMEAAKREGLVTFSSGMWKLNRG